MQDGLPVESYEDSKRSLAEVITKKPVLYGQQEVIIKVPEVKVTENKKTISDPMDPSTFRKKVVAENACVEVPTPEVEKVQEVIKPAVIKFIPVHLRKKAVVQETTVNVAEVDPGKGLTFAAMF